MRRRSSGWLAGLQRLTGHSSENNAVAYTYYQIVFPTLRGADEALMQIAEVELIGE